MIKPPSCWASLVFDTLEETKTIAIDVNKPTAGENKIIRRMKLMSNKILNPKISIVL